MTWTPSGSILLKTDWQYTEPIIGSYFKLKHSNFPVNNSYLVAQAEINVDGSVELADIRELNASSEAEVLQLIAPPVWSERRLAIKRIAKQPNLASELRRVIRNDLLSDSEIELTSRRSIWTVDIEVSNYIEPVTSSGGGTVTTPATSDQFFSNILLLLHFDGANDSTTFTDVKGKAVTPAGNAQISTTQSKFGGASGYFDGNGDYLSIAKSDLDISGNSDLTIEFCLYPVSNSAGILYTTYNLPQGTQGNGFLLQANAFQIVGATTPINFALAVNQWHHLAVCRQEDTFYVFKNGVLIGESASASIAQAGNSFVGGSPGDNNLGASWFNGYIDELRITKGVARYVTDFTPPTSPFPNN